MGISTNFGFPFSAPSLFVLMLTSLSHSNLDSNRCLATRQADHEWSTFVFWIAEAIVFAEQNGMGKATSNSMPTVGLYGSNFNRLFRNVIAAVGSYNEIYERNLEDLIPRQGLNLLADMTSPLRFHIPGILE